MTDDAMTRLTTALADRYEIERELGQGGMATVYLAHDRKHDRRVALKVLRPELAAVIGGARFLAEIRTTANLQHPHILSLFDSGETDGLVFYVMPYVEGESLRDRLARERQLPIDDAVRIAREVADALEYAHRHGVIHRDIKPENILLQGGHAQVADFGIALAVSRSEGGTRMTETGMSLGTPHYMSPEQAMGEREITPRADVYALGCVLYEMLVGEPPFTGPTAQAIIARVMTEQPRSLTLQRHTVPPHVEAAVQVALEKLPADRFPGAQAFADALAQPGPLGASRVAAAATPARPRTVAGRVRAAAPWVVALAAVAAGALALRPHATPFAPVALRYEVSLPDSVPYVDYTGGSLAYAPDGSAFAYATHTGIVLRRTDQLALVPLPGARRGTEPFFSPDGRWLAFLLGTRLMKASLDGGAPVVICDSCTGYQYDWGTDDTIRYHDSPPGDENTRVLIAVSARGGRAHIFAAPARGSKELFRGPTLIPGTRTVLFTLWSGGTPRLAAVDLRNGRITRFDQTGTAPRWVRQGFVVLGNADGTLTAVPFDARRVRLAGAPVTVASGVLQADAITPRAAVSLSGSFVYVEAGAVTRRRLIQVSRTGAQTPLPFEAKGYAGPRFSPDGRRIAVNVVEAGGGSDVWVLDLAQHAWSRLTTDRISERPIWMPDGRRLVYSSNADLWTTPADGSGQPDSLLVATGARYAGAVTPDGRTVVFQETGSVRNGIYTQAIGSAPAPRVLIPGAFNETAAALSPDGRWLAYQSDESGRSEVYVRPFPDEGARIPVSVLGGSEPAWGRDGRELFYRTGDSLMVAEVSLRPAFAVLRRRALFRGAFLRGAGLREYDVAPDGQHFVMVEGSNADASLVAVHGLFDRMAYDAGRR